MSTETRYAPFQAGSLDPGTPGGRDIVDDLVDRFAELREGGLPDGQIDPAHARALLATELDVQRCRPELWAAVADPANAAWLGEVLLENRERLLAAAAERWDRVAWQAAAERLDACYEAADLPDPMERAALARELLEELDEVQLAGLALERTSGAAATLAGDADAAAAWVAEHADAFLAAAGFVIAVGEALRPDLVEFDPDLALTAEKFVRVLEAVAAARAVVTLADVRAMGPAPVDAPLPVSLAADGLTAPVESSLPWTELGRLSPVDAEASLGAAAGGGLELTVASEPGEIVSVRFGDLVAERETEPGLWVLVVPAPAGPLALRVEQRDGRVFEEVIVVREGPR